MERRVHGEADCLEGPTGYLPCFEDLQQIFQELLDKEYTPEDYTRQFTIRVKENLAKIDRVEEFHRKNVENAPDVLFQILAEQRKRLEDAGGQYGDFIAPDKLPRRNA